MNSGMNPDFDMNYLLNSTDINDFFVEMQQRGGS